MRSFMGGKNEAYLRQQALLFNLLFFRQSLGLVDLALFFSLYFGRLGAEL